MLRPCMTLCMHLHVRALALATSILVTASHFALADAKAEEDLLTLAWNQFKYEIATFENTSGEERKVFEKFFKNVQEGKTTDFTPPGQQHFGATYAAEAKAGEKWGVDRTIKAEWIVWLCKDPIASKKIPPWGIEIGGAKIAGEVDLSWTNMQFPLKASGCAFTDRLILSGASLRGLYLQDAYIKTLYGDRLTVESDVNLDGFEAETTVFFRNATIAGKFYSPFASFHGNFPIPALDLSSAKIGLGVRLYGATANGQVRFADAEIKGDLICAGAEFGVPGSLVSPWGFTGCTGGEPWTPILWGFTEGYWRPYICSCYGSRANSN